MSVFLLRLTRAAIDDITTDTARRFGVDNQRLVIGEEVDCERFCRPSSAQREYSGSVVRMSGFRVGVTPVSGRPGARNRLPGQTAYTNRLTKPYRNTASTVPSQCFQAA